MVVILFAPLVVVGAVVAVVLQQRYGRVEARRLLRALAMSLAVLFAGFAGLFIAGETFAEGPGGSASTASPLPPDAAVINVPVSLTVSDRVVAGR